MEKRTDMRAEALDTLIDIERNKKLSHIAIGETLMRHQFEKKSDRAFYTRLCEGVTERKIYLDYILDTYSKTPMRKCKPLIRSLLRMGAYQILFMDVRDAAACSEAVSLAKKRGFGRLSGFVNGVLRTIVREKDRLPVPDKKEFDKYLSITYSVPEWLSRLMIDQYGAQTAETMFASFLEARPLTIRTNLSAVTPEELVNKLKSEGVTVHAVPELPYAFEISGLDYLAGLKSFKEGLFYVQDVSSMLVAETAAPKKNDYVIDVCAAPGGKSTHMAELLQGSGMVEARDLTEYKVDLIRENIARHGLSNMKAVQMDATVDDPDSHQKADVLVCDLPCSGLGVMGKKTDIRYKMTKEKAAELAKLQRQILSVVWDYVRPGGTLVYSTCTIHRSENEDNTAWFLKEHPEFSLEFQRQIFPGEAGSDGFFLAKLVRSK